MRLTVTKLLNKRIGAPSLNALKGNPLEVGEEILVVEKVKGDSYDGNDLWYKDDGNNYYWSGGVETFPALQTFPVNAKVNFPPTLINYFEEVSQLGIYKNRGNNVKVAVFDSGIADHPDLDYSVVAKEDFTRLNNVGDNNPVAHGTHLAGIISARCNGTKGIYGVAPDTDLYIAKINPSVDILKLSYIKEALVWAKSLQVEIINLSFTLSEEQWKNDPDSAGVEKLFKEMSDKGTLFIAAAGDDKEIETIQYPSALKETCITVGGTYEASFKPTAKQLKSGVNYISACSDFLSCSKASSGYYKSLSGASMNTAFISGICARIVGELKERKVPISKTVVLKELNRSAVPFSELSFKNFNYSILCP